MLQAPMPPTKVVWKPLRRPNASRFIGRQAMGTFIMQDSEEINFNPS